MLRVGPRAVLSARRLIAPSRTALAAATPSSITARRHAQCRVLTSASATADDETKYFMLTYDYVPEILEKRGPFREEHLAMAKEQIAAGNMVMGGPMAPPTGAYFLWKGGDKAAIEAYAKADPYVVNGLVPSYTINEWTVLLK